MRDYSFNPSWFGWVGVLILVPLFVSLGFWQLDRARERDAINALQEARRTESPLKLSDQGPMDAESLRYRRVVLEGSYDDRHQFLIDNQIEEGQPGYHVLVPLRMKGGVPAVLINRGWIPVGSDRRQAPDVSGLPQGQVEIQGSIDLLHRVGFKLKGAEVPGSGWPSLVQVPEAKALSERLGYEVAGFQVLLAPAEPGGYRRHDREMRLDSGKNRGYALQWFLFAGVTMFLFARASIRKAPKSE